MNPLELFHPIVREWFERRFGTPTLAQAKGWPAISENSHTLITAPTGSGKTLAAFLICIDRLLRAAIKGELTDSARVVYVSPLKALSNDIHKNLSIPLREISDLAEAKGLAKPDIRIAVRTGDTPARERRARALVPPHIWITTPESLYVLLTSESGRHGLERAEVLILDEIHSIAGNKRGSHLALSVERLCKLAGTPLVRIGLSATIHPVEEAARFLVGSGSIDSNGKPRCTIMQSGLRRRMDLRIEMPDSELGPIATHELWDETVDRVVRLILAHRTTLVFVNTRRLVERVSHLLSQRIGEENVVAHHGSLSRETRLHAEQRLKAGSIRVCVATASLELGIDIGDVDLVVQVGSPRSVGVLLQRVGRSGHKTGGLPKGRLFPLTRDELIECSALKYAVRKGVLDSIHVPRWPLDILSQQIVAMCAMKAWKADALFHTVRLAYPYGELPRAHFDGVVRMLSQGIATRMGRRAALLHYDSVHAVLRGRRGARLAAITCGGAIPDNADYDVILEPEGTYVGSVNEDFAVESMGGDVFLLGNTSWRIRRVEKGKVRVEDAHGQAPNIPFWMGEAPGRTMELSGVLSELREGIDGRLGDAEACRRWLSEEVGLSPVAAAQACAYIREGKRVPGKVPTMAGIVAERFFDETGGMQLVVHSPYGARINKACGLLLKQRFRERFGADLQASATDDGINLSLGPQHGFPLDDLLNFIRSRHADVLLTRAVLSSPVFLTRWRWTLTRSLALLRFSGGKRLPAPLQRMRADDILEAVFQGPGNGPGLDADTDDPVFSHPLVFETLRDCLYEAMDVTGLRRVLEKIESGEIRFSAKETPVPSVFSHQLLNAMPYAFLEDTPLQERRARAVTLRRALPESAEDLGRLDPEAIRSAARDAWPSIRDPEELHDALIGLVLFPEEELRRFPPESPDWLDRLEAQGRVFRSEWNGRQYLAAIESRDVVNALTGNHAWKPETDPVTDIVRGWSEVSGPVTASGLSELLGLPPDRVAAALLHLEGQGLVLRGFFSDLGKEEFCDRRILARIHRATIAHLRREIEPVPAALFLRFLFEWQHVTAGSQLAGEHGTLEAIDQLQGFEAAAASWEGAILPLRVADYRPEYLDSLCLGGDVVWGRWTKRATRAEVPGRRPGLTRTAPVGLALREDLSWLVESEPGDESALSVQSGAVLEYLRTHGASFFSDIRSGIRRLPSEVEEALWQLVAAGLITADSFSALRSLVSGETKRTPHPRRKRRPRRTREGRWSLLHASKTIPEQRQELWIRQYLRRYGILCREMLARESTVFPWRDLLGTLRRLEARGEIRGGRFIAGLYGEQFALAEAVDALRALRKEESRGHFVRISACDPLNLAGILTPGQRVAAAWGTRIVCRDGLPVAVVENGQAVVLSKIEPDEMPVIERLVDERPLASL